VFALGYNALKLIQDCHMKSKDRQQVDAESGCHEFPGMGQFPPAYLDRVAGLVHCHLSVESPVAKPLVLLLAPGIDAANLLAQVFHRLTYSYQTFDCAADGFPDLASDCDGRQESYALILYPESLSHAAIGSIFDSPGFAAGRKLLLATVRPFWIVHGEQKAMDCNVLGHRELRYSDMELQYLIDQCWPANNSHFDRHDLFAMTQGWPVISEYAIADLAQLEVRDGLRFFPLAHLDSVKQYFLTHWLPLLEGRYRWLIEVSNLPLLSLDLLADLFDDLGNAVQECLVLGWLESCQKNIGFYQINVTLDVLFPSAYPSFKNNNVLERAADWYSRNGYLAEALECLVSFVDREQVLSMLSDTNLAKAGKTDGNHDSFHRVVALKSFGAASRIAKDSLKFSSVDYVAPLAKVIIANVEKSKFDVERQTAGGEPQAVATDSARAAGVVEHIVKAFSFHQDRNQEAVSLAIAEAVDAGIDRQYLSTVLDFVDSHIRPLLRNEGSSLQLALRDLKHSAPAREVVAAQYKQLNHRELQVLQRICEGYRNKEISEQLGLELSTIKWYSTGIYEKLQVRNRTQAVAKAQALKLFD
jgi:DNA-binding NarL/FixJ family response regulator